MHASFAREVQRFLEPVVGGFMWRPALDSSACGTDAAPAYALEAALHPVCAITMIRTISVTPFHKRSVEAARAERQGNLDNWTVGFEGG